MSSSLSSTLNPRGLDAMTVASSAAVRSPSVPQGRREPNRQHVGPGVSVI